MHTTAAAARFSKTELRGTRTALALREASTNWHHVVLDCNVSASNDFLVLSTGLDKPTSAFA